MIGVKVASIAAFAFGVYSLINKFVNRSLELIDSDVSDVNEAYGDLFTSFEALLVIAAIISLIVAPIVFKKYFKNKQSTLANINYV